MSLSSADKKFLEGLLKGSVDLDSPVLHVLHGIQDKYGRISREHAEYISCALSKPLTEIYGAVTFYDGFTTIPRGDVIVRVCRGITCHSKGSVDILNAIKRELSMEKTRYVNVTLEEASCIGQCDGAPAMMINDRVYRNLTPEEATRIIGSLIEKEDG